jgi:phosphate-selective porin OprO/OprP
MHKLLETIIKYSVILLIVLASSSVWAAVQAAATEAAAEKSVRDEEVGGLSEGRKFIPAAEETAVKEPAAKEPAVKEPAGEEPAGDVPAAEKSVRDEEIGGLSEGRKFIPAAEEPAAKESAAEEPAEDEEVGGLGEGRKWVPEVSFPPTDPDSIEGEVYFWDRDFQIDFAYSNLHISQKRGIEYTRDDSEFYLRIGGRIYIDFVKYFEDKNDLGDNGLGIRNFTIEMNGRFNKQWLYRLSWGGFTSGGKFDGGGAFIDDAYVSYNGFKKIALILGQHKEPFGLEESSSSLVTTFMERGLPTALVTGTNLGASFSTYRSWWGLTAGVFAEDLSNGSDLSNQGRGLTGRIHFNPGHREDRVYHLGSSVSFRDISDTDSFYYRNRPESGLTDVRYVDTGDIFNPEHVYRYNIEAAVTAGPFAVQGEYIGSRMTREAGLSELDFYGWYVFASWFPTGGSRNYFPDEGIFGYPQVKSKHGELELAVRYSMVNLTDGTVRGGTEKNLSLGINWYLSRHMRLMANYIFVNNDTFANADRTVEGNDHPQILQFRFQYRI